MNPIDWMRKTASIFLIASLILTVICYQTQDNQVAVVFDPLSRQGETHEITSLLSDAGFQVTSYVNNEATVSKFKQIPEDTDVIVLRVHSSTNDGHIWIFTGEKYSAEKHQLDQVIGNIHRARITQDREYLFALGSGFFSEYLPELPETDVLALGCDGASTDELANVFLIKGASTYTSWDGPVSLEHTDRAFLELVNALINGENPENVVETMKDTNRIDPHFGSTLVCYKR